MSNWTFEEFERAVWDSVTAYGNGKFTCDRAKLHAIFNAVHGGKVVAELGPYSSCAVPITDEVILEGTELIENQLDELVTVPGKRYRIQLIELPEGPDQWLGLELCKRCDADVFGDSDLEALTYGGHRRPACERCGHAFEGLEQGYTRRSLPHPTHRTAGGE